MNFLLPIFLLLTPMKIEQTIPNDRDAELGLIGACLDGKFDDIRAAGVGEDHFFDLKCASLWRTMNKLDAAKTAVTSATVMHAAKLTPAIEVSDVLAAESACPSAINWSYFADIIDEKRKARRVMEVGQKLSEMD